MLLFFFLRFLALTCILFIVGQSFMTVSIVFPNPSVQHSTLAIFTLRTCLVLFSVDPCATMTTWALCRRRRRRAGTAHFVVTRGLCGRVVVAAQGHRARVVLAWGGDVRREGKRRRGRGGWGQREERRPVQKNGVSTQL